ncbi:TPA: hypothetical protein ACMY33_001068 [Yersinia enterocolitica]|nr:hypothetical protein [Yersinia enterocolitica]HDL8566970.1 hypothetical protein [Yersinia enterocolitica]HEB0979957.1 hypothetical protein [Yersinia enterocolitica]HEB1851492.1 hypothetical protein [Yersinia enterocolitica]
MAAKAAQRLLTNLLCHPETGGLTAPMGAPAAHAATTHSAHFPALLLYQRAEGG